MLYILLLERDYYTLLLATVIVFSSSVCCLEDIITGLEFIHESNLIHRDLHIGNILKLKYKTAITDMGLSCKLTDCNTKKNSAYGVLPYMAPEILQGQNYTKAADIYSFGIIMYEVISGSYPFCDEGHDGNLAIKICQGYRPSFNIKVPQLIVQSIKRCLDADALKRPSAEEIEDTLYNWKNDPVEIKEADEINNKPTNSRIPLINLGLSYETHSEAIYTSRLLRFDNLPKPKNSDDYYIHNDNIISAEFSVSLSQQIDASRSKINDNNLHKPKTSNDYYKQSDNIINVKSSASLSQQIDVSRLDINDSNLPEPKHSDFEQNNDIISMEYSESLRIDISQLNINEDGEL
ncbi:Cla4p [Rhizophagus irregularis DAOM 197198w]|uniref:Cla4p n=1 Tax=Rhizophagus irregularis (strain DAOM 197198w) TaxID=1432141 RepID=A0A015MMW3_RHIIW|nr:Cla4p [Rhizophagus irregularis DAOM 197198w]